MPMKNFWSVRVSDPEQYTKFRYQKDKFGKGIDVDFGIKDGKSHIQAIRFHKDKFTKAQATKWAKDHKFNIVKVESQTELGVKLMQLKTESI